MVNPPPEFVDPDRTPELWVGLIQTWAEDLFYTLVVEQKKTIDQARPFVQSEVNRYINQRLTRVMTAREQRKRIIHVAR